MFQILSNFPNIFFHNNFMWVKMRLPWSKFEASSPEYLTQIFFYLLTNFKYSLFIHINIRKCFNIFTFNQKSTPNVHSRAIQL